MTDKRFLITAVYCTVLLILCSCAASRSGSGEASLLASIDRLVVVPPVLEIHKRTETDEIVPVENTAQIAAAVDEVITGLLGKAMPYTPVGAPEGMDKAGLDSLTAVSFAWLDASGKKKTPAMARPLLKHIRASGRYGLLLRVSGISVSYRLTELVNLGRTEQSAGGKMEPQHTSKSVITLGIFDTRAKEFIYHITNIKEDDPLLVNIVQHQLKSSLKPLLAAKGRPLPTP